MVLGHKVVERKIEWTTDLEESATVIVESLNLAEQRKAKPEPPAKPNEMTGTLWCPESLVPTPELAAEKQVVVGHPRMPLTGVTVYDGIAVDVYLPTDRVKKLAKELNGQRMTITGEQRRVVVISKWFGDKDGTDVPAPKGKSIWVPAGDTQELPTLRQVIWATGLKPLGPKTEPFLGEPSVETRGQKFFTFKRLPKSNDVSVVKVMCNHPARPSGPKPLTVGNFPALLDGLKPIKADDEATALEARAGWCSCRFETSEGEFRLELYLGGRGILQTSDGRRGWVEFAHPK